MNKKHYLLTLGLLFCFLSKPFGLQAQVGYGTNAPMASAVLDLDSNSKGFLPPRMTQAQMLAIASPASGLIVYCTDCVPQTGPHYYNGADFVHFAGYDLIRLSNLDCSSAVSTGTLYALHPTVDTNFQIPYTVSQGGVFPQVSVQSTGVLGLEATVFSGSLATGSTGNLFVNISGRPTSVGTATFPLSFGGQACTLEQEVLIAPVVASLDCAGATDATRVRLWNNYYKTLDVNIPYTAGNGEAYPLTGRNTFPSRGVTGLTATILPGTLANGSGNIQIRITGVPNGLGQAYFDLDFGSQTCTYQRAVTNPIIINNVAYHRIVQGFITTGSIESALATHGIIFGDLPSTAQLDAIARNESYNDVETTLGITLGSGTNSYYYVIGNGVNYYQATPNQDLIRVTFNYGTIQNWQSSGDKYYVAISYY